MKSQEIQSLVKYRLEQANESLEEADLLIQNQKSPRGIINRSYYAMFYATLSLLHTIGKGSAKHSGVLSLFNMEFIVKGILPRDLGRMINKAFDWRQKADYEAAPPINREKALETYQHAQRFIEAVKKYLSEQEWT
jgi:uncharacterized protein (UPF0332 family)